MERRESKWTISKEVPVTVLVAVFIQSAGAVWWLSKLENRISNLESQRVEMREQTSSLPERITRLEVQQAYANELLVDLLREMRKVPQ